MIILKIFHRQLDMSDELTFGDEESHVIADHTNNKLRISGKKQC